MGRTNLLRWRARGGHRLLGDPARFDLESGLLALLASAALASLWLMGSSFVAMVAELP